MVTNILDVSLQMFDVIGEIPLNFLESFIGILIGAVSITGFGIILYCLILKAVTLPLDVWQKASMRKQSLKMDSMREQLEKLQKQYENYPELYQKKMQEVYKQNNFNMFASCIPMLVTLVVLIFAFQSLTGFSQYMNLKTYTDMAQSYDAAILKYCDDNAVGEEYTDSNYLKYESSDEGYYIYCLQHKTSGSKEYYINTTRLMNLNSQLENESDCLEYVKNIGRAAAAESYKNAKISFFWIKNIYYADVAWVNPLESYDEFCSSITRKIELTDGSEVGIDQFINATTYNEITYNLSEQKTQPNGYFILVVLTILANLGSQFITMRSQKAQRELQTADKNSQSMQKWMTFLMPVLLCVFAFIYSAAFSLYLITSSLFSLVSTLIVNKVIDTVFNRQKKIEEAVQVQTSGRKALTRDWKRNSEIMGEQNKKFKNNKKK